MTTVSTGSTEPAAIGANDQDLAADHEVGEYRIERAIGKGGFGTVYGATHPLIGKRVAIKVLARKYSADPEIVSRFVAEARAVNQIRHRNIIDIFSFGQLSDGRHYYVMEYLDGEPLDAYLREHGPMTLEEALPVLRAMARALDAAHAKGIAHRDLKPENIFLAHDTDGAIYPKLLDFGIAKLLAPEDDVRHKTGTGVPIGTPYYMSPEQCRGREVDHRTDIYSFGIVTYRLLTGTFPFEGEDYMELLFKQTNEEPPPPSSRNPVLTPAVDAAIAWMMRKDRAQRPPNVSEGVRALDPGQSVTPAPPLSRGSRPSVPPAQARVAAAPTSSPDALAATFTPEFERPSAPELAPTSAPAAGGAVRARRAWPLVLGLGLVLGAGGAVAFAMLGNRGTPAAPAPATPSPASATPAPVEPAPAPPAAMPAAEPVADADPPPVGSAAAVGSATGSAAPITPLAGKKRPRPRRTDAAAKTATHSKPPSDAATQSPAEPTSAKNDIIHLGSDSFPRGK